MVRPVGAFGQRRPLPADQPALIPEAAAVGPIEEDGSAFLLLLATMQREFLFKLDRAQLSRLQSAIQRSLRTLRATPIDARLTLATRAYFGWPLGR
jgi:hypothetical protein